MKLAEYLGDLDPELAAKLDKAIEAVREEFEEKLTATVQAAVTEAADLAAARAAAEPPAAPPEQPARPVLSLDAADELRMAALDIDVATTQSEILDALSRGVRRFASRVAIFVYRGNELHGWNSSGFGHADEGFKEVVMAADHPFPAGADRDEGSFALSSADCAVICDALGADHPTMGLLMPFVLGSQVVGMIYCDRIGDDPFSVSALQLLTYISGQTLETLPVRKSNSTATLNLVGSSDVSETVATVAATVPEVEPEPEVEAPRADEPADPLVEPISDFETEASGTVELPEPPSIEALEPQIETPLDMPPPVSTPAPEVSPAVEPEVEPAVEEEEATRPGSLAPEPSPETAVAPPPSPTEPTLDPKGTAVAPPDDIEGPGWAFATSPAHSEASSDSEHEEAQRLARLLVTEIKLYNEEAVEQGRSAGNVYSRLHEDIDRSRQIFEGRIDEGVRSENDYFKQALVKILAGGDASLLGI